ncbi:UAP56-interacting factor [Lepisosteus oculatus]|uniref:UAP56-interacting factor n=1 Tax=Lepisosteus oculatus TaxID=7918 RepID=UPI0003EA7E0F|nr:PREDICTED: UAP56-interacting factor [Lepisosteus oculatus]
MSGIGFKSGGVPALRNGPGTSGGSDGLDKIDMSLDDIIRLNRKEQRTQWAGAGPRRPRVNGRLTQGWRGPAWAGGQQQRGVGYLGARGRRGVAPVLRRRGQGVVTGLAARRNAVLLKGISPLNRPPLTQRPRPLLQRRAVPYRQTDAQWRTYRQVDSQRQPYGQVDTQRSQGQPLHRPIQLRRRNILPTWPPASHHAQREARQATFLFRRGLKVQAQVQNPVLSPATQRTRPWRTSTTSGGILTISIDNPTARIPSDPPRTRVLRPPLPPTPLKQEEPELRKTPKGVALQFDINSVGKQTAMTLNERFRILKDQRSEVAQSSKSSRFVTVG